MSFSHGVRRHYDERHGALDLVAFSPQQDRAERRDEVEGVVAAESCVQRCRTATDNAGKCV
jgi:hypothetical protein